MHDNVLFNSYCILQDLKFVQLLTMIFHYAIINHLTLCMIVNYIKCNTSVIQDEGRNTSNKQIIQMKLTPISQASDL